MFHCYVSLPEGITIGPQLPLSTFSLFPLDDPKIPRILRLESGCWLYQVFVGCKNLGYTHCNKWGDEHNGGRKNCLRGTNFWRIVLPPESEVMTTNYVFEKGVFCQILHSKTFTFQLCQSFVVYFLVFEKALGEKVARNKTNKIDRPIRHY